MADGAVLSKKIIKLNMINKVEKKAKDQESFWSELEDINHWVYDDMRHVLKTFTSQQT